jgi:hypothetical protein
MTTRQPKAWAFNRRHRLHFDARSAIEQGLRMAKMNDPDDRVRICLNNSRCEASAFRHVTSRKTWGDL